MSKKRFMTWVILVSVIIISIYRSINEAEITKNQKSDPQYGLIQEIETINFYGLWALETEQQNEYGFTLNEVQYMKDGINITYPQIISGASNEKIEKWNSIITEDLNKILQVYSLKPINKLPEAPTVDQSITLTIHNKVKLLNNQFLSILYTADYFNPHSAYPTQLVYTTNIDTKKDTRLKISDFVKLDASFAKSLKDWDFTTTVPGQEEWNMIIKDIIGNISDESLLRGLEEADNIGSGNPLGIYSYLTQDKLGISVSIPNFVGDHVEFEKKYSEIANYLSPNYQWN